jgi:hypothetical protein
VKLATYARRCESYFANTDNRPFSILEACDAMGIDYETLRAWEIGEDAQFAALARRVKTRVAAGWEKGELTASMATYLHKSYIGEERRETEGPLEIVVRVEGDGA